VPVENKLDKLARLDKQVKLKLRKIEVNNVGSYKGQNTKGVLDWLAVSMGWEL
jgi:hypothetical protein